MPCCARPCTPRCRDLLRSQIPAGNDDTLIRGGSVIVDPLGQVLAGPIYGEESILADIDLTLKTRSHLDLDVVGHYARPDVFQLFVDDRARTPVPSPRPTPTATNRRERIGQTPGRAGQ